jgi:hypothetical protein
MREDLTWWQQTALSRPDVIVRDGLAALAGDIIRTVGR